jgi:uncharacterized protein with von Willebrand factor type A (vWA) domain
VQASDNQAPLLHHVARFGEQLRESGIPVNPGSLVDLCSALNAVGWRRREDVHAAARTTLVTCREQLAVFDSVFDAFWGAAAGRAESPPQSQGTEPGADGDGEASDTLEVQALTADGASARQGPPHSHGGDAWSDTDVLTHRDLGSLDDSELERARRLVAVMVRALFNRPGRRHRPVSKAREIDFRRSFRRGLSRGFDGLELRYRRRKPGRLKLLLLCDVSGSMQRYSEFLLQFVYALRDELPNVEAAVFATHMTPITRPLAEGEVARSLQAVTAAAPGWGGGTDIGQALLEFNDYFARDLRRSRSVVVILSDGWDRGDAMVMRRELRALRRCARQLVWLNPLLGAKDYQPLCRGIRLALPHLDHFLPAHDLASLAEAVRLLRRTV